MASSNIARLGIVFGVDTAELEVKISKAKQTFHEFTKQVERDSNNAAKDLVALRHATEDYGKTLTKVEQIEREIKAGRYQRAEGSLIEMLRKEAAAYDAKAAAIKKATGAQFAMNEQQKIQLTYQTTDLFTQIASGQSPFIAILQQGGQLKDVMGGIKPMFQSIGTLFTVTRVIAGGLAAAIGSVGYAFYKAKDDLDQFKDAMTLTNGFAGVTYDKLLNLGNVLSGKTSVAIGDARDVMQQLAASGKFTYTSIKEVGEVILNFSKISGVDATKAAETLIPLLDGTASSAKQLNDKYHFLTLEQYKQIKALEKQGQLQESIRLQSTLLNQSFQTSRRELGFFEESWKSIGKWASWAWDSMMGWGRDDKGKDLQKLNHEIALATAALNAPTNRMSQAKEENQAKLDALLEQRKMLLKSMLMEDEAAKAKAKAAAKNAKDISDENKYGEMLLKKSDEVEKAKMDAAFVMAKQGANEIEKLEIDSAKKIVDAYQEMQEKNRQEDGKATTQNLEIYKSKVLAAEKELSEKKRQIAARDRIATNNAQAEEEQKLKDMDTEFFKMKSSAEWAAKEKTKSIEFQQEEFRLKNDMLYATEKEMKLAQLALEYKRKREEPSAAGEVGQRELDRQEALERFNIEIQDSMKKTGQVFESVWGNLGAAIDKFVQTGKFKMKDFAASVIRDLIAIEMKAQASTLLRGVFKSFIGSFNGGGFGTGNAYGNMDLGGFFADGGDPPVGKASIVGERGPELFVPRTAGTIIPNNALGGMGGQTINYNGPIIQNMSAIDTQSGLQFLAKNRQGVFAAYQSANRSIPTSR